MLTLLLEQQLQNASPAEFRILYFLRQLTGKRRRCHRILLGDQNAKQNSGCAAASSAEFWTAVEECSDHRSIQVLRYRILVA